MRKGLPAGEAAAPLSTGEWLFAGAMLLGVALVKVWLPIVIDSLELLEIDAAPPWFLGGDDDDDAGWWQSLLPWLKVFAAGAVVFADIVGAACTSGVLSTNPGE